MDSEPCAGHLMPRTGLVQPASDEAHRHQHPKCYGRSAKAEPGSSSTVQLCLIPGVGESFRSSDYPAWLLRERLCALGDDALHQYSRWIHAHAEPTDLTCPATDI